MRLVLAEKDFLSSKQPGTVREIKQKVKGSTLNTPETEEVLQALGFRGASCTIKAVYPHAGFYHSLQGSRGFMRFVATNLPVSAYIPQTALRTHV